MGLALAEPTRVINARGGVRFSVRFVIFRASAARLNSRKAGRARARRSAIPPKPASAWFAYARKTGGRTALVGRRAGVASGIAALTVLALSADRKFEPRLYHYDEWLARQRRAWAPRGPDGQFRIATE